MAGVGAPVASAAPDLSSLPLYDGIDRRNVHLVHTAADASAAFAVLSMVDVLGFDTESKPTFTLGEVSTGPHLIQLATDDSVYLFPVTNAPPPAGLREILESQNILKVGFGLGDDLRRLQTKLGIHCANVLDLANALRDGGRNHVGAKAAVARFFGQRFRKSKKTSTTNWSNARLTDRQILYAANDAHVALRIYRQWRLEPVTPAASSAAPSPTDPSAAPAET